MILPALFLLAAWGGLPKTAGAAPAFSAQNIEAKVALESSVEKRLQAVLSKMLGTDDLIVIVNVELLSEPERKTKAAEVMPGVPLKETPAVQAALELSISAVRRVAVTVYVDQEMRKADIQRARGAIEQIVGLKPERGDILSIEKMALQKRLPSSSNLLRPGDFLMPSRLLSISWLVLTCLFLLLFFSRFIHPFLTVFKEVAGSLKSGANPGDFKSEFDIKNGGEPAQTPLSGPGPGFESNGTNGRELPFSFIEARDLPTLNVLLSAQPAHAAAAIIHYLPATLASQALGTLKPELRQQVVARMTQLILLDHAEVRKLEESIRSKIDCMTGGEEKLTDILNEAPMRLQSEIMNALRQKDPAMCRRLQQRIVLLEDIAWLNEADLMTLSRQVPVRSMAAALKFSESLKQQVMPKLKSGLGEWLAQEIEFSANLSEEAAQTEIRRVLRAMSQLIREGKIILRRNA